MLVFLLIIATSIAWTSANNCTITGNSITQVSWIMQNCENISVQDLIIPAGQSLNFTNLQPGTTVTFKGTTSFEYAEWEGWIFYFSGTNITVTGAPGHLIDGNGARWWDGLGGNGGKIKPKLFRSINLYNSIFKVLHVKNSPRNSFSIYSSENLTYTDITIDLLDGDENGAHNTDAFNLNESKNIYIMNNTIYNQDDCMAINSGREYYFYNNYCSGGHGISIGSIGNNTSNVVENVHVKNCTVVHSENGIRIKTKYNAYGEVRNITYEDITIANITAYGVVIRGDYKNSGPTGTPTDGVIIDDVTIKNVHGWVDWNATNVYVLLADGVASNWKWTDVNIVGSIHNDTECKGHPENSGILC